MMFPAAITMGMKTISARKIILLAEGEGKAMIIKKLMESAITTRLPASFLRLHPDVTILIDREAAKYLPKFDHGRRTQHHMKKLLYRAVVYAEHGAAIASQMRGMACGRSRSLLTQRGSDPYEILNGGAVLIENEEGSGRLRR